MIGRLFFYFGLTLPLWVGCVPVSRVINTIPEPVSYIEVFGAITSVAGAPLESVLVRVPVLERSLSLGVGSVAVDIPLTSRQVEMVTDATGSYSLRVPANDLPENFLLLAHKDGFIPAGETISKTNGKRVRADIVLKELKPTQIIIDDFITLHHLGDDSFSGSINSQFQMSTEGLSLELHFQVEPEFLSFQRARLSFLVKGAEDPNEITVNGETVGYLDASANSGGFTTLTFDTDDPTQVYQLGDNVLAVTSGDTDDFEFTNIMIEFFDD